ncbi:MAG: YfhO family protein [Chloroflexota bacterium]|nr:YfhO family protein [Chloroflexota bacterium]
MNRELNAARDAVVDRAIEGRAAPAHPIRPAADARSALPPMAGRIPGNLVGVGVLLILTMLLAWPPLAMDWALARTDALIYFIPLWGHLGERLAAGDIPAWSAAQFAGMPFAGDPESGWMYLPAMLTFPFMSAVAAFKVLVLVHLAVAALGTFAFGRVLGLGLLAAVVAAAAYEFSALLEFTRCCTAYVQVMAWLPWALLGVELAIRATRWLPRVAAWTLAGFAISQILGAWMGQGAYNALLVIGGYVAYRTVLEPPAVVGLAGTLRGTIGRRLSAMVLNGFAVVAVGVALGAAGILPRIEANSHSTLAGGVYDGAAAPFAVKEAWPLIEGVNMILSIDANGLRYYAGGATLTLALLAPLLARRRFAVPFFAAAAAVAFVLALEETVLHRLFYLLPRFELIHEHYPERALIVFYLPLAMLAGATVAMLPRSKPWLLLLAGVPFIAVSATQGWLERGERPTIDTSTPVMMGAVALLLGLYSMVRLDLVRRLVPILLLLAVVADPNGLRAIYDNDWHEDRGEDARRMLDAYQYEGGAAGFLLDRLEEGPVRYAGYDIQSAGPNFTYHSSFQWPVVPYILVNNRATYVGLQDLSGYNPLQHERFRELLDTLNRGQPQDYHQANLLSAGLDSPLLDLFNVRYIVIPNAPAAERADFEFLLRTYPTVYQDQETRVLENPNALPRAWLVHDAVTVAPGAALEPLANGTVDFRTTAILEQPAPPLAQPMDQQADRVEITEYSHDRMTLTAFSDAPGLVMVSDTYDPNWHAYVDGERVDLYVADHALRAVPMPAGEHTIELRYEPRALSLGIGISLGTVALLTGTLGVLGGVHRRRERFGT